MSGGIDSQACALWLRQRYADVILVNSDAGGNEHPLTTEFLHEYSRTIHPIVFLSPIVADMAGRESAEIERRGLKPTDPLTFDLLAELKKCFPARRMQFCTEHLKLRPLLRWFASEAAALAEGFERYTGVRADESQNRKNLPESEWDELFDCTLHRPLLRWTKQQCFDFVLAAGEPINELYRLGFGRVGCTPCVNSNKDDIRLWAARFPEMIDKVSTWEKRVGRTFFRPVVKGGPLMCIDDMVRWSRTTHGGKQMALPMVEALAETEACSSKYGLCE
jgi:3'-phosphoadenosine 5'-phosphosulfate sulfotransferase (PAPS reductase)/FAD synthetase